MLPEIIFFSKKFAINIKDLVNVVKNDNVSKNVLVNVVRNGNVLKNAALNRRFLQNVAKTKYFSKMLP